MVFQLSMKAMQKILSLEGVGPKRNEGMGMRVKTDQKFKQLTDLMVPFTHYPETEAVSGPQSSGQVLKQFIGGCYADQHKKL